jgi:hypothetical protein
MAALNRIRIFLAALLLVGVGIMGAVAPVLAEWRLIVSGEFKDDVVRKEADRYLPLIGSLPARGVVGYLQADDWPSPDAQRQFYLAEYSLTPRILVMRTDPEFVIVVPEAAVKDDHAQTISQDPRLADFALLARFDNGLRVFRRLK